MSNLTREEKDDIRQKSFAVKEILDELTSRLAPHIFYSDDADGKKLSALLLLARDCNAILDKYKEVPYIKELLETTANLDYRSKAAKEFLESQPH